MKPSKPSIKPAVSPTPSTDQLEAAHRAGFKERAEKMAQEFVDNLSRNALADKAKYEAMVKKTS
jgi:hypothetical protein